MNTRKLLAGPCFVLLLTIAACQKETADQETPAPVEESAQPVAQAVPEAPVTPPAPTATPPLIAAAATPEPPQLAPPGTFFLLKKTSVETADGIVGVVPGTELHEVTPGVYEDLQKNRLTLRNDEVTNDLKLARQARGADSAAQAAIARAALARQQAEHARQMMKPTEATPTASSPPPTELPPTATPKPLGSSLGGTKIGETHDSTKGKVYLDSSGNRYWKDAKGRIRYDF